eukprot:gnl/MRDRNA2_/MRDRNA2_22478_c0_seq1.p1 gnl/MRDRNA2_/MRDRNA2_22478_c0~~gnl/MRDRNA2_/MRDRNA2_22478_c0_seq1.p1  ORF type:complete len:388 (-),score=46.31 gnl/MRDRNA2_/MRDRNA2_22478_c0_seq1:279-1442(-)
MADQRYVCVGRILTTSAKRRQRRQRLLFIRGMQAAHGPPGLFFKDTQMQEKWNEAKSYLSQLLPFLFGEVVETDPHHVVIHVSDVSMGSPSTIFTSIQKASTDSQAPTQGNDNQVDVNMLSAPDAATFTELDLDKPVEYAITETAAAINSGPILDAASGGPGDSIPVASVCGDEESRVTGSLTGAARPTPPQRRRIVRAVRSQPKPVALPGEDAYIQHSLSELLKLCHGFQQISEAFSRRLKGIDTWQDYLECHLEHLARPAQTLISKRAQIHVEAPGPGFRGLNGVLAQHIRSWVGSFNARPPSRSIALRTLLDLQVLCHCIDELQEALVENPLTLEDNSSALNMLFEHIGECNHRRIEAIDFKFRHLESEFHQIACTTRALYCPS